MRIEIVSAVECPRDQKLITMEECEGCELNSGHLLGFHLCYCGFDPQPEEKREDRAALAKLCGRVR